MKISLLAGENVIIELLSISNFEEVYFVPVVEKNIPGVNIY